MQSYTRPHLTAYGPISDLTKSKFASGTDSFAGGQPQPGECIALGPFVDCPGDSRDSIILPPTP